MAEEIFPIGADEAAAFLQDGGPLALAHPGFEERQAQIDLLCHIVEAFNDDRIGVFEAGTGVGKSFAYLIPAILWHLKNHERVVISTGTVNLQHQLVDKDLPVATGLASDGDTQKSVKFLLVKGRNRYVCLRRLEEVVSDKDLFADATDLDSIVAWVKVTADGSREDLSFVPDGGLWAQINSESDSCMGQRCPHREQCFVMRLKKKAAEAGILVVNHHLLFADIASRLGGAGWADTAVLPPYTRLIIDEAHGIEDAATSFFSAALNRFAVTKELGVLYHTRKSTVFGLLPVLQHFSAAGEPLALLPTLSTRVGAAMSLLDQVGLDILEKIRESSLRLCPATEPLFADLFPRFEYLAEELHVYLDTLHLILEGIAEEDSDQVVVWEARQVFRRLTESALFCADFIAWKEHPDKVFWFDRHNLARRPGRVDVTSYVVFTQTPLNIAPKMVAGVFEPLPTVVALSATLRIGKSFDSWMRRMGLQGADGERVFSGDFPSPFPYRSKVFLAICTDGPIPTDPRFQEYTNEAITALIKAAGGRTLVLFTATNAMRAARDAVGANLCGASYTLLTQGDDDRSRLLDLFKADTNSVLFATDSFWEGVDVPGESLSQVIIVKLPFPVPGEPVFAARSEAVEKQGGNSFASLSIPDGVIKFRQGFGRLMRHTGDYGCVVVLDRRLVEKSYGHTFIDSIPETKRLAAPLREVVPAIESFLEKNAKK